ncbi:uncharacterized protein DEA37_0005618, partial [Paragonimus westermani]
VYLQLRQPPWCIPAVRVAFQTVFLALGVLTCVTRITDNKHHQTDVLAGGILGFSVALSAHLNPQDAWASVRPMETSMQCRNIIRNVISTLLKFW